MVTTVVEMEKRPVYERVMFTLLEKREEVKLDPENQNKKGAFNRYLLSAFRELSQKGAGGTDKAGLDDIEKFAKAMRTYAEGYGFDRYNDFGRHVFEQWPNGEYRTDRIIRSAPPLEPYEFEQAVIHLYQELRADEQNSYRLARDESPRILLTMERFIASMCEMREITQEVPDWFKRFNKGEPNIEDAWNAILLRLANRKDDIYPIGDLDAFKQQRLAKDAHDSASRNHCYALFLPWTDKPSCATYTHAAPCADAGCYDDEIEEIVHDAGPIDDPQRMYVYSTVNMTTDLKGIGITQVLYRKVFGEFSERFADEGHKNDKERMLTVSPLTGFPAWLAEKWEGEEAALEFTYIENSAARALGFEGALGFLQHYISFSEREGDAATYIASAYPNFDDLPEEKREEASQLFDGLMEALGKQYFFEGWEREESGNYKHRDLSVHLNALNGARLVNINFQQSSAEWQRSGGLVANFHYLASLPSLLGNLYRQNGWLYGSAMTANSIEHAYTVRKEKLHAPQTEVEADGAQSEDRLESRPDRERD